MTPDQLRSLVHSSHTPLAFAAEFSDLEEATRKSLSKTAQELYREARKAEQANWGLTTHQGSLARLALLACGPWSQAKRIHGTRWRVFHGHSEEWPTAIVKLLTDRRPDWAGSWVELQLEGRESEWERILNWQHIRELVKAGVIERPDSDGYVRVMAGFSGPKIETLVDDDVLEQDVWRLFEVDTNAFEFVPEPGKVDRDRWRTGELASAPGPYHEVYYGWPRKLYEWAHQGRIDRGQLIDATLRAFWYDFRTTARTGLLRFLEILELSEEEIASREATFRELLRSEHGPVVGMAVRNLVKLHRARELDAVEFLAAVPAVFNVSVKSHAARALSLIDRVVKKNPARIGAAVNAVAAALNHESIDVQEQAVALLASWKDAQASIDLSDVLESATMLAPSHRRTLQSLLGSAKGPEVEPQKEGQSADRGVTTEFESRKAAITRRLASLPHWIREVCGLCDLEDKMNQARLPSVFDPAPTACPVLSGVDRIEPIRDVDELIDVVACVLSSTAEPEDEERVVDGIVRLGHLSTDNFEAKTEGLRDLIAVQFRGMYWLKNSVFLPVFARRLIIGQWLGVAEVAQFVESLKEISIDSPFACILQLVPGLDITSLFDRAAAAAEERISPLEWKWVELYERLERGEYGPVLSTPTHKGGWIDPRVFVARIREVQQQGLPIGKRDFIGGLLRLAPDFREVALESAHYVRDPYNRIVRYALGGSEVPSRRDIALADEWLAAGRARSPCGFLRELNVLKLSPEEPDGITPARYSVNYNTNQTELRYSRWDLASRRQLIQLTPDKLGKDCALWRPTVALAARVLGNDATAFYDDTRQQQIASLAPLNVESTLALAARDLIAGMDEPGSAFLPVNGLMESLLHVDRGWSEMARRVLWLGTISRDGAARGLAVDALIDGIVDGRADVDRLSETLIEISAAGLVKWNRLADSLRQVGRTSVLAERIVAEIIDQLMASWASLPRNAHYVLSLQAELLANLGHAPCDKTRQVLGTVKGSSKTAKLAKRLLEMRADGSSSAMHQTILDAAEGRLARAERIARHVNEAT